MKPTCSTFLQHLREDGKSGVWSKEQNKNCHVSDDYRSFLVCGGGGMSSRKKLSRNGRFCWWWNFFEIFLWCLTKFFLERLGREVKLKSVLWSKFFRRLCGWRIPVPRHKCLLSFTAAARCWPAIDNPDPEISAIFGVLGALNTRLTPESRLLPLFDVT